MIKGILWDLDGVIADTEAYHFQAMKQALATFGYSASQEIIQRLFGTTTEKIITAIIPDAVDTGLIVDIKRTHSRFFCENIAGKVAVFPGVMRCLEMFAGRGMLQAIASSSTIEIIDSVVNELHIRPFFQALVSGADLPPKPDPAVFLKAAVALGLAGGECVVIEDSPMGIASAHAAGMCVIAVATSRAKAALADAEVCVGRLDELPDDILDQINALS
jgi:beta-phosphoglucomutase-like phosphatase (HAD superfamily)